jgi:glycosyltransferase involved in cell wall biosynthesis
VTAPRVVVAAPIYNKACWLPEAVESLLDQTYADFALLLIDDRSDDGTTELARAYADRDARVQVVVNGRRLGMLANTNRAFRLAIERFPEAVYWALASDHDRWEPRWLEALTGLLDGDPDAVLAYPLTRRIDEQGDEYARQKPPWRFETAGEPDSRARMRHAFRGMAAGDMIYGLFRVEALRHIGLYRPVLVPDRLLLSELALHGQFVQAPEILWRRRFRGLAELDRQRALFWPDGAPAYARLPWWAQHAALVAWDYGWAGKGRTVGIGRGAGLRVAAAYLDVSVRHRAWRRWRRMRGRAVHTRNALLGPPVKAALRRAPIRRAVRTHVLPMLEHAEIVLTRHTEETP